MTSTRLAVLGSLVCLFTSIGCQRGEKPAASAPAGPPAAASSVAAGGIAGAYAITSANNPGGEGRYSGSVDIARKGDFFTLDWTIAGGQQFSGVGLQSGNVLGVGWGIGGAFGVVVYEIDGGKLRGRWAVAGADGVGTEDLEGPADLNGTYAITSASAPNGQRYAGEVLITPAGETYNVEWKLPGSLYSGIAIRTGNLLIAGWGQGVDRAGVVSYDRAGTTLTGRWASPGDSRLGSEVLAAR